MSLYPSSWANQGVSGLYAPQASSPMGLDNLSFGQGVPYAGIQGLTNPYGGYGQMPQGLGQMGGAPSIGYGGPTGAGAAQATGYSSLPDWVQQYANHYLAGQGQSDVAAVNLYNEVMKGRPADFVPYAYTAAGGKNAGSFDLFHDTLSSPYSYAAGGGAYGNGVLSMGGRLDPITGAYLTGGGTQDIQKGSTVNISDGGYGYSINTPGNGKQGATSVFGSGV